MAAAAAAQFNQYISPGSLALAAVPTRERLETALAGARYRLGPVTWSPFFAIKDVTYVKSHTELAADRKADLTATAALGVHAYLTPRKTVYVAAHAVPEYAWWRNNRARTVNNWSYGTGVFIFSRVLTLEATAVTARHQEYLSSAVEELVNVRRNEGRATVDVPLGGRLGLFATASTTAWRYRQEDVPGEAGRWLAALDRDEESRGGGVRWRVREGCSVGVGYEEVAVRFPREDRDRSASGTGPVLAVAWEGRVWNIAGRISRPALEPDEGSEFVPFEDTVGTAQVGWRTGARTRFVAYGGRSIGFSYRDASPYFVDRRVGLALERQFGWRSGGSVYYEVGEQRFVTPPDQPAARLEELATLGGMVTVQLRRSLSLSAGASRTEYTASAGGAARRPATRVQVSLRSGDVRSQWW